MILVLFTLAFASLLTSCQTQSESAAATAPFSSEAPLTPAPVASPQRTLDGLDARTPVPLLPMMANHQKQNMRDHLLAVQEIVAAAAIQDFTAIEKATGRLGFSEQMGRMCEHMGAGAPGFTELALRFHRDADEMGAAARKHDGRSVLTLLARTLSQCTGCHETYKQHVVSEAEWSSSAGTPAPHHRLD